MAERDEELHRLREELELVRAELATLQRQKEKWGDRTAKLRRARQRAEKGNRVLGDELAKRLRYEAAGKTPLGRLLGQAIPPPTRVEVEELAMILASPLFDAAWYLTNNLDVARDGYDPGLHFLRFAHSKFRNPGPDFDVMEYFDDHPTVLKAELNPLVHFLTHHPRPLPDSYPPRG